MEGDLQVFYRGAKRLYTHQKGPLFESMSITVFVFLIVIFIVSIKKCKLKKLLMILLFLFLIILLMQIASCKNLLFMLKKNEILTIVNPAHNQHRTLCFVLTISRHCRVRIATHTLSPLRHNSHHAPFFLTTFCSHCRLSPHLQFQQPWVTVKIHRSHGSHQEAHLNRRSYQKL